MQFRVLATSFVALIALSAIQAAPAPEPSGAATDATALSCQACEWWGGANLCCSASCIGQRQGYHGGYCDSRKTFLTELILLKLIFQTHNRHGLPLQLLSNSRRREVIRHTMGHWKLIISNLLTWTTRVVCG